MMPNPEQDRIEDKGASSGSRASTEPQERLGPTGFDPARMDERMAQLLWIECCPGIRLTGEDIAHYRKIARIMLTQMREPTEMMIDAYFDRCRELGFHAGINATAAWSAMIDAELERDSDAAPRGREAAEAEGQQRDGEAGSPNPSPNGEGQ